MTPGAVKYINRGEDKVEKQFRYNCGELPVLYKSEQHGRYIYVMDGAVTAYAADGNPVVATELGEEVIVPPCITQQADGRVQIGMDIEDGGKQVRGAACKKIDRRRNVAAIAGKQDGARMGPTEVPSWCHVLKPVLSAFKHHPSRGPK